MSHKKKCFLSGIAQITTWCPKNSYEACSLNQTMLNCWTLFETSCLGSPGLPSPSNHTQQKALPPAETLRKKILEHFSRSLKLTDDIVKSTLLAEFHHITVEVIEIIEISFLFFFFSCKTKKETIVQYLHFCYYYYTIYIPTIYFSYIKFCMVL